VPLLRKALLIFGANLLLSAPLPLDSEQTAKPVPREAVRVQFNDIAAA